MKNQKNERGITLVALVVTIVVLLILAGITIMYVMGDNSVFGQASQAKTDTELGAVREAAMLSITANVLPNLLTGQIVDDAETVTDGKTAEEKAMELFKKGLYTGMTGADNSGAFTVTDASTDGKTPASITITDYEVSVANGSDTVIYKVTYDSTSGLKINGK